MVENFPNEFQQTPSRINSVSQDTVKLLKDKNKEEIAKASRGKVTHRIQRSLQIKLTASFSSEILEDARKKTLINQELYIWLN